LRTFGLALLQEVMAGGVWVCVEFFWTGGERSMTQGCQPCSGREGWTSVLVTRRFPAQGLVRQKMFLVCRVCLR